MICYQTILCAKEKGSNLSNEIDIVQVIILNIISRSTLQLHRKYVKYFLKNELHIEWTHSLHTT